MTLSPDYVPERDRLGAMYGPVTYVEYNANVTVSGTTEGTATLVVTGISFVANGTDAYVVKFYCPQSVPANADFIIVCLFDNAVFRDRICLHAATTNNNATLLAERRFVPTAGAHVLDIRAFRGAANGVLTAGIGGTGVLSPGFLSVSKA